MQPRKILHLIYAFFLFPRVYNNQHWVIQEAEQRRLAESRGGLIKPPYTSPAASSPATSLHSQKSPSPVYENLNHKQTAKPGSVSQARPDASVSPAHSDASWHSQQAAVARSSNAYPQETPTAISSNAYPQENLYANLGSVPPPQPPYETSPLHFQRYFN
jgi:hypothetical protein